LHRGYLAPHAFWLRGQTEKREDRVSGIATLVTKSILVNFVYSIVHYAIPKVQLVAANLKIKSIK
jgi:hypothetical protein